MQAENNPPHSYGLQHLESVRDIVDTGIYSLRGRNRLDKIEDIREDYRQFQQDLDLNQDEAALQFMASAGMIASRLESEQDQEELFAAVRDALGPKNRMKLVIDFLSPGEGGFGTWMYKGVEEDKLKHAYNTLETGV